MLPLQSVWVQPLVREVLHALRCGKKNKELEVTCAKHLRQELIRVGTQKMAGISISDPALRLQTSWLSVYFLGFLRVRTCHGAGGSGKSMGWVGCKLHLQEYRTSVS